jgi:hypothetical protein
MNEDGANEYSISALFIPIISEIREYLENLARAELGEE